jgi:hypothetical protein
VHADLNAGALSPTSPYYFVVRCTYAFTPTGIAGVANSDGSATFDGTYPGGAGHTVQFDGNTATDRAGTYFLSPVVTL